MKLPPYFCVRAGSPRRCECSWNFASGHASALEALRYGRGVRQTRLLVPVFASECHRFPEEVRQQASGGSRLVSRLSATLGCELVALVSGGNQGRRRLRRRTGKPLYNSALRSDLRQLVHRHANNGTCKMRIPEPTEVHGYAADRIEFEQTGSASGE